MKGDLRSGLDSSCSWLLRQSSDLHASILPFFLVSMTRLIHHCDRTKPKEEWGERGAQTRGILYNSSCITCCGHHTIRTPVLKCDLVRQRQYCSCPSGFPPLRVYMLLNVPYGAMYPGMLPFFTVTRLLPRPLVVQVLVVLKRAQGRAKSIWPRFKGPSTNRLIVAASDSYHTVVSK